MVKPLTPLLREYDLTDAMRRDRRSLLAVVLISFMDFIFDVSEKVVVFEINVGQVFPVEARRVLYCVLLAYFSIMLASRYFGIFYSGKVYEFENEVRPLFDTARESYNQLEDEITQSDEQLNEEGEEGFNAYLQGMKDRIAAESHTDRRNYTVALAIKTTFEVFLPLLLAIIMFIWAFFV